MYKKILLLNGVLCIVLGFCLTASFSDMKQSFEPRPPRVLRFSKPMRYHFIIAETQFTLTPRLTKNICERLFRKELLLQALTNC